MLFITTEGGIVRSACTDNEALLRELTTEGIMVIDYDDPETLEPDETWWIKQGKEPDAKVVGAYVSFLEIGKADVDVDHLYQQLREGGGE